MQSKLTLQRYSRLIKFDSNERIIKTEVREQLAVY